MPSRTTPFRLLAAGILLAVSALHAQTAADLAQKVDDHYNHLNSLQARYTERYTGMGMDRTETGTLLLKKPGRMRWSYEADGKPTGKLFVLDGKFAWFYNPGDAQVQKAPAKQLDDLRSPLRFLLGHTQLQKELGNLTLVPNGANFHLSGIPTGMQQRVKSVALTVTPTGIIQNIRIEETDGTITEFTFTNMQENLPIPSSAFIFTLPAGVAITKGQPPI
jgi:outer membrane lipoprotein carrier protein